MFITGFGMAQYNTFSKETAELISVPPMFLPPNINLISLSPDEKEQLNDINKDIMELVMISTQHAFASDPQDKSKLLEHYNLKNEECEKKKAEFMKKVEGGV